MAEKEKHSIYFQLERIRAVGCGRDLALGMDDLTSCDKVIHVPCCRTMSRPFNILK